MSRIKKNLFVTGTDTGVGKTVVAAAIAGILAGEGYRVRVMKPVQSGARQEGDRLISPDLEFLLKACRYAEKIKRKSPRRQRSSSEPKCSSEIKTGLHPECSLSSEVKYKGSFPNVVYCFEPPVSPNLAAQLAGEVISSQKIIKAYKQITSESDITIVEGIGGLLVPLNNDYLVRDLILDMNIPIVIVARPGLGTINHTLLTLETARRSGIEVKGVVINGVKPEEAGLSEKHSPKIIAQVGQIDILGILPFIPELDVESGQFGRLIDMAARHLDLRFIYD